MALRGVAFIVGTVTLLGYAAVTSGPLVVSGWQLDPGYPVMPETTELHLLVQQYGSGASGSTDSTKPVVARVGYATDSISISVPVRVVGECLAELEPTYGLVVQLTEPVGRRQILPGPGETLLKNLARRICPTSSN